MQDKRSITNKERCTMKHNTAFYRIGILTCSLFLVCALVPSHVFANEEPSEIGKLQGEADALVAKIEATTTAYQEAEATVIDLEEQISQNEARAAELEAQLPAQRERTAASVRNMYVFQQTSSNLLEIILTAESFDDFLTTLRYLDTIHEHNTKEITALSSMTDELAQTKAMLTVQHDAATQRREEARAALEEARAARTELQTHAITIATQEKDNREAALQVVQHALDEAAKKEGGQATFVTSSGNTATIEIPETTNVSTDPLVSNVTSDETGDWASRINAYLEGSPLAGYGETFAAAAAQYGVDPRLSPAIATIESGKGSVCFKDHNAWGWGSSNWDSWESAIYEQVEGLATGYDGTLTLEGAERYCPPNYQEWYSSVASEMDGI